MEIAVADRPLFGMRTRMIVSVLVETSSPARSVASTVATVNSNDDGSIEVITAPYELTAVKIILERAGFKAEHAEVTMKPENEAILTGDDGVKMQKLLDALESIDDVQDVYTTAVIIPSE